MVAAQHVRANLIDRVAEVLSEVVVWHVEAQTGLLHPLLEALQAVLLVVVLQSVEQHEAEVVDHPRLQRQPRLAVLQLPEVVLVEREVILMGDAVEVQSVLPFQVITLLINVVGDAANAIEVVTRDLRVAVSQSFDNRFVGQSDGGTCVLLFSHFHANLIKNWLAFNFCVPLFVVVNDSISHNLYGYQVSHIETGDLNVDGYPEVYVFLRSTTPERCGALIAYSPNNGKSLSQIYLPKIEDDEKLAQEYAGHDEMEIVENSLCRRFPIKGTNKMQQMQYHLEAFVLHDYLKTISKLQIKYRKTKIERIIFAN